MATPGCWRRVKQLAGNNVGSAVNAKSVFIRSLDGLMRAQNPPASLETVSQTWPPPQVTCHPLCMLKRDTVDFPLYYNRIIAIYLKQLCSVFYRLTADKRLKLGIVANLWFCVVEVLLVIAHTRPTKQSVYYFDISQLINYRKTWLQSTKHPLFLLKSYLQQASDN